MPAQIQFLPVDWKPTGGLAGIYDAENRMQMDRANEYALRQAELENVVHAKNAAVAKSQMGSPEWMDWNLRGEMGRNQSSAASGQYDQGVVDSRITNTKAKNKLDTTNMEIDQQIADLDSRLSVWDTLGPEQAVAGMDDEDRQLILQDPIQGRKHMEEVANHLKDQRAMSVSTRSKMFEQAQKGVEDRKTEDVKGTWNLRTTKENTRSREAIEGMAIEAGKYKKVLRDSFSSFYKLRTDAQLAQIIAGLKIGKDPITQEPLDDEGQAYWSEQAHVLSTTMNAKNQAASTNKAAVGQFGIEPTAPPQVPAAPRNAAPQLPSGWTMK